MNSSRDVIIIKARVAPHEIGYLNAQLDACEGLGVMRTIEPKEGRIVFWVSPDLLEEFYKFIEEIQEDVPLELDPASHGP